MWFGDLVTMRWWNGIWLNEAFATFMEMFAVDRFRPDWKRWSTFALSRSAAFDTDALAATRPIEFPVVSPADAEGMFDILTYEKGASVLRMLEQYLGPDSFRRGIRRYLSTHAYRNTETGDLWEALETATDAPVRRIAESWIFQAGHPVVSVRRGDAPNTIVLGQAIAVYLPGGSDTTWAVPLGLRWADRHGNLAEENVLLDEVETVVELSDGCAWVIVNRGAAGFFRTSYAPDLHEALASSALDAMDATERYTFLDDTWAAVLGGTAELGAVISVVRALAGDDDLSVWRRIAGVLANLHRLAKGDDTASEAVAVLVRDTVRPLLDRLGATAEPGEPEATTNLRATAFEALGRYGNDTEVLEQATAIVERTLHGAPAEGDDPSLIDAAVHVVAVDLDDAGFDRFLAASRAATTPQDTLRYLGALADVRDGTRFDRFLGMLLGGDVRTQDVGGLLNRSLTNRDNVEAAWTFTEQHWETLNERLPTNAISRMVTGVRTITDPALSDRVAAFLRSHSVPQAAKAFAQHIERMQVTVGLAERARPGLAAAISAT